MSDTFSFSMPVRERDELAFLQANYYAVERRGVPPLIEGTRSPSPEGMPHAPSQQEERLDHTASSSLSLILSEEAFEAAFNHPAWQHRLEAIRVVASFGKHIPLQIRRLLRHALPQALRDISPSVRSAAAQLIADIGGTAFKDALFQAVNDSEPHVRASIIHALGSLHEEACYALLEAALDDPDELVQEAAIWALTKQEEQRPNLRLISMLKHPNAFLRATATEALGTMKEQLSQEAFIQVLMAAADDEDEMVRAAALRILGTYENGVSAELFLEALHDEESVVRATAIHVLGERGEVMCIEAIMLALPDEDELVQEEISQALGKLSRSCYQQLSSTFLLSTLLHKHASVRRIGTWVLGELREVAALPALIHLIVHDPCEEVRVTAACALGEFQDQEVYDALAHVVRINASTQVRIAALAALGMQGPPPLPLLLHLIDGDNDEEIRIAALSALGKCEEQKVYTVLRRIALHEPVLQVRIAAITMLGEMGDEYEESILDVLLALMEDQHAKVQQTAESMLSQRIQRDIERERTVDEKRVPMPPSEKEFQASLATIAPMKQSAKMEFESLLNFVEGKKGFVLANTCNEKTLVLNFSYQYDEEYTLYDALITSLAPDMQVHHTESALSDVDAEVRAMAARMYEQIQGRPVAETLIVACDLSRREPADIERKIPMKMIICLVGYHHVRYDDVTIRQSLATYLHPNRRHPFFRLIRDWTDIAFGSIHTSSHIRLWHHHLHPFASSRHFQREGQVQLSGQRQIQKKYTLLPYEPFS
jgi:HEAT repeat protein